MVDELVVPKAAMRDEARKWRRHADKAEEVSKRSAQLWLDQTAFMVGNVAVVALWSHYERLQTDMSRWFREAAIEFNELGGALDLIVDLVDSDDRDAANDINLIFGE